jgi:hypothetical protein
MALIALITRRLPTISQCIPGTGAAAIKPKPPRHAALGQLKCDQSGSPRVMSCRCHVEERITCGMTSRGPVRWLCKRHGINGVHPAALRFYTVAYFTPSPRLRLGNVQIKRRARSNAAVSVLQAISTPWIETLFMACNMTARSRIWRAFRVARHDNTS